MSDKPRKYDYAGRLDEAIRLEVQAKAFGKIIEKELEILDLKPNMKVLDAGCGTGAVTRRMALKLSAEEACGIDIDPLFIDEAKKSALKENIKNIRFEVGNIDNLKHEDGTFDLSYCRMVLMHARATDAILHRLADVGYVPEFGAWELKRKIQTEIETPLAREILSGSIVAGDVVQIDFDKSSCKVKFAKQYARAE